MGILAAGAVIGVQTPWSAILWEFAPSFTGGARRSVHIVGARHLKEQNRSETNKAHLAISGDWFILIPELS
jgi:hypothetical protein